MVPRDVENNNLAALPICTKKTKELRAKELRNAAISLRILDNAGVQISILKADSCGLKAES